ncbi:MAG TPA: hypothetical protein VIJ28_06110 [Chloroflexota bacterium]|jgi:hypothetical protein
MYDTPRPVATQRRFDLLLPSTQRALGRNGIWEDKDIAALSDGDLRRLAYIGPVGRQDIRRLFPNR